jgi:hypothetical protein
MSNFGMPPLNGEPADAFDIDLLIFNAQILEELAKPEKRIELVRFIHLGSAVLSVGAYRIDSDNEDPSTPFIRIEGHDDTSECYKEYTIYFPPNIDFQAVSDYETLPIDANNMYLDLDTTVMPDDVEKIYTLGKLVCELQVSEGLDHRAACIKAFSDFIQKVDETPMSIVKRLLEDQVDLCVSQSVYGFDLGENGTLIIDKSSLKYPNSSEDDKTEVEIKYIDQFGKTLHVWVNTSGENRATEYEQEQLVSFDLRATTKDESEPEHNLELPLEPIGQHQIRQIFDAIRNMNSDIRVLDDAEVVAIRDL